jgi:predicted RNase H-like nuclease (RuvC/YqgF family)
MSSENELNSVIVQSSNNIFSADEVDKIVAEFPSRNFGDVNYPNKIFGKSSISSDQDIRQNQAFMDITKTISTQAGIMLAQTESSAAQERDLARLRNLIGQLNSELKIVTSDLNNKIAELNNKSKELDDEITAHAITNKTLADVRNSVESLKLSLRKMKKILKKRKEQLLQFRNASGLIGWTCSAILKRQISRHS